jgi:hypothetical protein
MGHGASVTFTVTVDGLIRRTPADKGEIKLDVSAVRIESAQSRARIVGKVGAIYLDREEILEAVGEDWWSLTIDASVEPFVYSSGFLRAKFPKDGNFDGRVKVSVDVEYIDGRTDEIKLTLEQQNVVLNGRGIIPHESWMPHEYGIVSVKFVYGHIDELWAEDVEEDDLVGVP